jgi:hypothetical protein
MSTIAPAPLNLATFIRDHSAFAAEVAVNRSLRFRLMRVVELMLLPPTEEALEADIRAAELRIVMGLIAAEVKARSEER